MKNWTPYFNKTRPVRPHVIRAISLCKTKRAALDLGCGTFIDTNKIAENFKFVIALDNAKDISKYHKLPNISFYPTTFDSYIYLPNEFNFINAQYALPFHGKKDFPILFKNILKSLKKDGIFAGQLFGVNDGWKNDSSLVFHTKKQVLNLLKGTKIIEFMEEESEKKTAEGKIKHWHVFHFIIKK